MTLSLWQVCELSEFVVAEQDNSFSFRGNVKAARTENVKWQ